MAQQEFTDFVIGKPFSNRIADGFSKAEIIIKREDYKEANPERKYQLSHHQKKKFLDFLGVHNITYTLEHVTIGSLVPMQKQVTAEKVDAIKKEIKKGKKLDPILTSKSKKIIDGHHRWETERQLKGKSGKTEIVKVHAPAKKIFALLDKFNRKEGNNVHGTVPGA